MFIFRHPATGHGVQAHRNIFLMPLQNRIWLMILFFSVLILLTIYAMFIFEKKYYAGDDLSPLSSAVVVMIGILSQQGVAPHFHSTQAKIAIIFALLMSFLCVQYYTSSIVGSLLTPTPKSINDCDKLAKSDIKLLLEDTPASIGVFKISYNQQAVELYKKKILGQEQFSSIEDGIKKVQQGGYALFTFVDYAYDLITKTFSASEIDELQQISVYPQIVHTNMYFPVKKFSPYKEPMRLAVQWMHETGVADYWQKHWNSEKPLGDLHQFKMAEVDFYRFSAIFYMLAAGHVMSLVILAGELLSSLHVIRRRSVKIIPCRCWIKCFKRENRED